MSHRDFTKGPTTVAKKYKGARAKPFSEIFPTAKLNEWNAPKVDVGKLLDTLRAMKQRLEALPAHVVKPRLKSIASIATLVDDLTAKITDTRKASQAQADLIERLSGQVAELSAVE